MRFKHHYTLAEARALLPQVREWLKQLHQLHARTQEYDSRIDSMISAGNDIGGDRVNRYIETLAALREILQEFQSREIQLKDITRGLIDFPALRDGREIFLCWEQDEDDIEHWHDLESGYAGREKL